LEQSLASLPGLVAQHGIVLVIIDSIAALLRSDMGERAQLLERQQHLGRQAAALKQLAERNKIPVLVTNQVPWVF
jgi:RecA/RadA recombinase